MTDFDRLERLRGFCHTRETPIAKPDCLDEYTVAALADGTLDADARGRALEHVATCALCRRAVASVAEALADGPITHEIEIVEGRRRRRGPVLRIAVPLAAAATVLVLLLSPAAPGTAAATRDDANSALARWRRGGRERSPLESRRRSGPLSRDSLRRDGWRGIRDRGVGHRRPISRFHRARPWCVVSVEGRC